MVARENRFAAELNDKEVRIELLKHLSNILGLFLITPLALVGYDLNYLHLSKCRCSLVLKILIIEYIETCSETKSNEALPAVFLNIVMVRRWYTRFVWQLDFESHRNSTRRDTLKENHLAKTYQKHTRHD